MDQVRRGPVEVRSPAFMGPAPIDPGHVRAAPTTTGPKLRRPAFGCPKSLVNQDPTQDRPVRVLSLTETTCWDLLDSPDVRGEIHVETRFAGYPETRFPGKGEEAFSTLVPWVSLCVETGSTSIGHTLFG